MKKNIFALFLFIVLFSIKIQCENITIASWNINKKYSTELINAVCNFVKNENVDILCLQEVKLDLIPDNFNDLYCKLDPNSSFVNNLKNELNKKTGTQWEFTTSANYAIRKDLDPNIHKKYDYIKCSKSQDNAIFYRKDKFKTLDLISEVGLNNFRNAAICYKMDKNNIQIIEFTTQKSNNNLIVINVHLPYASRRVSNNNYDDGNYYRDFNRASNVYDAFDKNISIMCGDFNFDKKDLHLKNEAAKTNYAPDDIHINEPTNLNHANEFNHTYEQFIFKNDRFKYSVIKKPQRAASKSPDGEYIIIGTNVTKGQRIPIKEYKANISDHTPIIMTIDL